MLQTHSQSETLAHIHWHMFLYLHVGWAPCRLSSLSLTTSGPDHESIHVRLTHMFCGGFSKSEPAHLMCDLASTAIQIQKHSHSDSKAPHVNEPSWPRGLQILWNGHLFFGDGFFSGFDWSFQVEHFERADDTVLRLMNSKPRRKAKKPALKRPAKASRKQPAVASPQIPEP